jgi:hypothetical protein
LFADDHSVAVDFFGLEIQFLTPNGFDVGMTFQIAFERRALAYLAGFHNQ